MEARGIVQLVGAGPGDPGLLTLAGAHALEQAQAVVYDHLVGPRLLDRIPPSARRIFAGKRAGRCEMTQPEINTLLVDLAQEGLRVVRLKGGDPYVFGRGAEEAEHLAAAGIPFRVVPGVTAGVGATAYAGLPVTHRDAASAVAFVTGHDDPEGRPDWKALAQFPGTLVVYMGTRHLPAISRTLIAHGLAANTPAALVHAGTTASQAVAVATLADLPALVESTGLGAPALVVIGQVVARRPNLNWFENLPLFGRGIAITRPEGESDRSAATLEALGAEVLMAPMVEIRPLDDYSALDGAIARLSTFDWLAFTSTNGVRAFLDRLDTLGQDLRALGPVKLAAIGPATAEALAAHRLKADLIPPSYRSEALAEALKGQAAGRRILLVRADRGRTILKDELDPIAHVEQVAAYRNIDAPSLPPQLIPRIEAGTLDWITLTSPAITRRLHALLPATALARIGHSIKLASLSPVTSAAARELGWEIAAEAETYTWDGLVAAILRQESAKS